MQLKTLSQIEQAARFARPELFRFGVALVFVLLIMLMVSANIGDLAMHSMLVAAAMISGYMAMNIGANDVANNVGPAVGSKALTLAGAIAIAAIFEASGALMAGTEVVSTIKKGIIDPGLINDSDTFVWLMMAALLAGILWLNLATAMDAPVSTTQSIVGGVLGAGIAAGGIGLTNWSTVGIIAAGWVLSPILGGIIAAALLYLIKRSITYRADMKAAAQRMVPILVSLMAWAFSSYLILKGLKRLWTPDFTIAALIGLGVATIVYLTVKPLIFRAVARLPRKKSGVNKLFTIPLIFAAAILSFAHGANDVASVVGPLAAINDAILHGGIVRKAAIPLWIMAVGGIGIAIGLALYGPKLIRTLGSEITDLDQMRAFSIAMAAATTVIIATELGLPVSSTHVVIGAVFGVGFLREFLKASHSKMMEDIETHHRGRDRKEIEAFLVDFRAATVNGKARMLRQLQEHSAAARLRKKERKGLQKVYRAELVKRSALLKIAAAWAITVPVSGLLAAMLFFMIRGFMLP